MFCFCVLKSIMSPWEHFYTPVCRGEILFRKWETLFRTSAITHIQVACLQYIDRDGSILYSLLNYRILVTAPMSEGGKDSKWKTLHLEQVFETMLLSARPGLVPYPLTYLGTSMQSTYTCLQVHVVFPLRRLLRDYYI